jgi:hypothetical protein
MAMTQHKKGERFRALHEGEPFVIPNPWDAGSAKVLAGLGFEALATTSGGFAFTLGRHDGRVTPDEATEHARTLAEAVDVPVSVDLENGYGPEPEHAADAIERVAAVGAVGGSIEDWDPGDEPPTASQPRARLRAGSTSRYSLPRAPRTTSAETLISTTRSRACRRSSARVRMCSTRRGCEPWTRSVRSAMRRRSQST